MPDVEYALTVDVDLEATEVLPGGSTWIDVRLKDARDGNRREGEVCVMVVDRSFLDLTPHVLLSLDSTFAKRSVMIGGSVAHALQLPSCESYKTTLDTFLRRLDSDPYAVPRNWPLRPP